MEKYGKWDISVKEELMNAASGEQAGPYTGKAVRVGHLNRRTGGYRLVCLSCHH